MVAARRDRFVQAYVYGPSAGNASAAYIAAGYSPRGARFHASRLATNGNVKAAIAAATAERNAALKAEGIARLEERLRLYNETVTALEEIKAARGADPIHALMPGGDTGLLTRRIKTVPSRDPTRPPLTITESAVDTGWITSLLNTLKQAAQDTGQWKEAVDVRGHIKTEETIGISIGIHDAETAELTARLVERLSTRALEPGGAGAPGE
jgi:Terminase small subunit